MVQNKHALLLSLIVLLLSACTIKENIQRDINIETDSVKFNIPVTTNIVDTVTLAEINSNVNLTELIVNRTNQFTVSDLKSAHITGFKIELVNPDSTINNLMAFDYLSVKIKGPNLKTLDLGVVNNNSTQFASSINVPITGGSHELKEYLSGGFTYIITAVTRTATTKIINAKAVAQYKLTLEM